jgi:hypothetical protein
MHVMDHVRLMVEVHALVVDGKPRNVYGELRPGAFYVCPGTGILCRLKYWRKKRCSPVHGAGD